MMDTDILSFFSTLLQALQHSWFLNPEMPTPYGTLAHGLDRSLVILGCPSPGSTLPRQYSHWRAHWADF